MWCNIGLLRVSSGHDWKYSDYKRIDAILLIGRGFEQRYSIQQGYSGVMEIIESIAWVGLGFVPTLAILELAAKKGHKRSGIPLVRSAARFRSEVEA